MRLSKFGEAPSSANVRATVGELVGQSASSSYLNPARVGGSFRRWAEAGRTDVHRLPQRACGILRDLGLERPMHDVDITAP
jgi:hypothetical protein